MIPVLDYRLAMAAGQDAGNRHMRSAGRMAWNEEDREIAVHTLHLLLNSKGAQHPESSIKNPASNPKGVAA